MPESMFGRPLQHLLPSHPSSRPVTPASHSTPVPPRFEDVHFSVIGKPPGLLSRISVPQPNHTDYHSPTPSPTSTPPPALSTNDTLQPQLSSRPTLFQQLADTNSSAGSGCQPPTQPNASLASRIQMDINAVNSPSPSQGGNENKALIPPVEVLHQAPDSSPTPVSSVPVQVAVHDTMAFAPPTGGVVQSPPVSITVDTDPLPPFTAADAMMQDIQPPPSSAPINSLVARQERLQAISVNLANLVSPLPSSPSHSASPDPSAVAPADENTIEQPGDSQHNLIVLRHPYPANPSSDRSALSMSDPLLDASDAPLALIPSPATITQEYETHRRALTEAFENLNFILDAANHAQIDSEQALAQRVRTLEDQRVTFEQRRRAEVSRLQRASQELQEKREELNAREAFLASLEKESKAREDARKVILARRQVREEEKRAADAKRNQEVQEQIAAAIKELKEIESLTTQGQFGQSVELAPDDLPTEPQGAMNEDEKRVVKSRNALLNSIKNTRRRLTSEAQQLEELERVLRRLEVERKRREAEECLRAHTEAERARQVHDHNWRQLEAERRRREVEEDRGQGRLLREQQLHAEAQARGLGHPAIPSSQAPKHHNHIEEDMQPQAIPDTARIRVAREANSISQKAAEVTEAGGDGIASAPHYTVSHTSPGSGSLQPNSSKQKKPVSGGVMLAIATPKAGTKDLPPKPSSKSFMSSDCVVEKSMNVVNTPLTVPVPTDNGHEFSFPAQLASEFNRSLSADRRRSPEHKPPFPRTPKSKAILDTTHGGNQELNIGPVPGVSPTQQNVNLRHLKRSRGHAGENDGGDPSVRKTSAHIPVKKEMHDTASKLVSTSLPANLQAPIPPRPTVIPPPRPPKPKKHESHAESPFHSVRSHEQSVKREEASVTIDEQASFERSTSSRAMHVLPQLPVSTEIQSSLLLGPVHREGRPKGYSQNHATSSPISAIVTLPRREDGEDLSSKSRGPSDDHRRARSGSSSQRVSVHHTSPPVSRSAIASPPQSHRLIDSARQPNASSGSRVEPTRAPSPAIGRKRLSEHDDSEYSHRARRQRGDSWVAHDYDRVDSYRPHRDRRIESDEERRAPYRIPQSPPDRIRSYPSNVPRVTYDNKTYVSPSPEGHPAPPLRREQFSRRSDNDDYQRHRTTDQHRTDDIRMDQTYKPMAEGRTDVQSDPSLLARMTNSQHYPPSNNHRGRGRGDLGRGRGRGVGRGLLDRITSGPSSLGDRLT